MAQVLTVSIARTADGNGLPFPTYSSQYHVGLNLQAALPAALRLEPGDRAYVPTGIAVGIPDGYCGFVVSQPNLAKEQGLVVLDAPKVVHPADRGPLILSALLLTACSQFEPFEDMRREAGQIPTVGQSSNNRPAICYNPLWHDQEQLQVLADQACARTGRKAIFQDSNTFACRLINPSVAIYTCE